MVQPAEATSKTGLCVFIFISRFCACRAAGFAKIDGEHIEDFCCIPPLSPLRIRRILDRLNTLMRKYSLILGLARRADSECQ